MSAANELIEHWQKINLEKGPFRHPNDKPFLDKQCSSWKNCEHAVESYRASDQITKVIYDIYPAPYSGDIRKAKIFLLMLNPSWAPDDLHHQIESEVYRKAEQAALWQQDLDERFPNHYLNPNFCWSGGYRYWEKKLKHVAAEVRDRKKSAILPRSLNFRRTWQQSSYSPTAP
ncbi:hypothetical protein [Frigidibacter sp.]|uniref:hypothetical protein n=1 Tax=Frigidibacter sp. TaxID=2586418 RepID=UPI002735E4EA|nr:hypothetical protein [Frigidibacter sp.]MDP3340077.1 hypothetical protein [Frigidibacter sp.]